MVTDNVICSDVTKFRYRLPRITSLIVKVVCTRGNAKPIKKVCLVKFTSNRSSNLGVSLMNFFKLVSLMN